MYSLLNTEVDNNSKRLKTSQSNKTYLWHLHLGYIGLNKIQRLVKDKPLSFLEVEPIPQCESCLEGKMTKRPFGSKGNRLEGLLGLVHSDICGPMSIKARGGYEYYVTFIDDYSRYGYVYLMHRKSGNFDKFKEFRAEVEKQLGVPIKSFLSDRGGEYLVLTLVKVWLAKQFDMKDLGEANFVLIFTLGGGTIVWRSIKQSCIADSTMEAEYVAASEASKEVVWLHKFFNGLEVIPGMDKPITLYCDNTAMCCSSGIMFICKHGLSVIE
ncbi:hypothetical protein UlMin_026977 [Ulmus minor]